MKRKFAWPFLSALGLMLAFSGSVWAAPNAITVTLSSPQTEYLPGQNNTFTFNVGLTYTGAEFVDRYQFVFPAGVTVVSATPASGAGSCATNAGIQSICGTTVAWGNTGSTCSGTFTPTGCGVYSQASSIFTVTADVPVGFTGPMAVTLNSVGDGFGLPAGSLDTDAVTFAQGGTTPPQFGYSPASGQPVNFAAGGTVGATSNGSVAVSVATAGVGTGASATTTTTCTAPTAPFSGFGQMVTAVGAGAISGGPLSGTCTLGNTSVTQTLTCSESRGGVSTPVSFTLTCPAGLQPPLSVSPASGSTLTLPSRSLGSAATTSLVTFQNPGGTPATVTCTAPTAPFSASPLFVTVPAGGSASTAVSYTSTSIGSSTGSLVCTVNLQQFTFNLSGTTVLPAPAFIPVSSPWALGLLVTLMGLFAGLFVTRRNG